MAEAEKTPLSPEQINQQLKLLLAQYVDAYVLVAIDLNGVPMVMGHSRDIVHALAVNAINRDVVERGGVGVKAAQAE